MPVKIVTSCVVIEFLTAENCFIYHEPADKKLQRRGTNREHTYRPERIDLHKPLIKENKTCMRLKFNH